MNNPTITDDVFDLNGGQSERLTLWMNQFLVRRSKAFYLIYLITHSSSRVISFLFLNVYLM